MDTITAISTCIGKAAVSIIKISGGDAFIIGDKIFKGTKKIKDAKSHTILYGHIFEGEKILDDVLVSVFKAPNTFTGENLLEINCHGSPLITSKILELILKTGARYAEKGEFTKRAFLNGKLDLVQAETVADILDSKTQLALEANMNIFKGKFSSVIEEIRGKLLDILIDVQALADFPEEVPELDYKDTKEKILSIMGDIEAFIATAKKGRILREGLNVVIIGKPNVGKSSIFNAMLRENRAIVTEIPGTTRDILKEYIDIKGIPLKITDTAGIRLTEDLIEKIGVEKSKQELECADVILYILDAMTEPNEEALELYETFKNRNVIVVFNKTDKLDKPPVLPQNSPFKHIVYTSAKTNYGIEELENMIYDTTIGLEIESEIFINTRHKDLLVKTLEYTENILNTLKNKLPLDFLSADLEMAVKALGEITGKNIGEEVVENIFERFCVGK